ncbi:MAG: dUTP diphosphatase [Deferribacteraceae bacterium]|jgi:dUTP pyrophosphatase|nr:dUTP diphosphatase [Deferribacteraceae bacterium]
MNIKITVKDSTVIVPEYKTAGSAGMDICAYEDGVIEPHGRKLVPTGISMEIPDGYECQIRPRSGLALKHGIGLLNAPGTIDSDYRGEVGVILYNSSAEPFHYKKGDRIAQMVFASVVKAEITVVTALSDTVRGEGGFGSTGL